MTPQQTRTAQGLGLVADIGGTNARFVALDRASGEPVGSVRYASSEPGDSVQLLRRASADLGIKPHACVLAVAGPVEGSTARLTNGQLTFDKLALESALACPVELINDFVAMSRAVPELVAVSEEHLTAVMGPGTGLGVGFLVPTRGGVKICPSEGGHAGFAPSDELEQELLALLRPSHPILCWENLVSGPGLVTLYEGMCALWGADVRWQCPEDISKHGVAQDLSDSDPICHKTLEVFMGLLGSAAGNLALTLCARGGVFLVGDLLAKLADVFAASQFRQRFDAQGVTGEPSAQMLKQISTELLTEPDLGLMGATHYAGDLWSEIEVRRLGDG